jgi:hypothetical protein
MCKLIFCCNLISTHSVCPVFKIGPKLPIMTESFHGFPQSLQPNGTIH